MIALSYSNTDQRGDLTRSAGKNLDTDSGLETAVTLSLFTNARAKESDTVDPKQDKQGWWGSIYLDQPGEYGSRLWLVTRDKLTNDALIRCTAYAKEALQWLLDSKIAAKIEAVCTRMAGKTGVGLLTIKIQRSGKTSPQFQRVWEVQFGL